MILSFGITLGEITVAGVALVAVKIGGSKLIDWWRDRRSSRRERVHDWHRELQDYLSDVRSVGRRVQNDRKIDLEKIEELIPATTAMDARVNTPPSGVLSMVDRDTFAKTRRAAGLAYHLAHLPAPDQNADSIAGVMRHQYKLLQELEVETDVEMGDVLEIIGAISQPEELDLSTKEAKEILDAFEKKADRRMEDAEEMTVDELMELPWGEVDQVISERARRDIVRFSIDQYYEIALLEAPKEARAALQESEDRLFG